MKILLATLAFLSAAFTAVQAMAEKRVALVIGNSAYAHTTPLANPKNDAKDVSAKLQTLGFDIVEGYDLDLEQLKDTVRSFARSASSADLSIFYYAGHGISIDNVNYIVPVEAKLNHGVDWEFEVYEVAEIMRFVQRANHASLIFFDACRDNPLANELALVQDMGTRSVGNRGMSRIPVEQLGTSGSVIAYATEPGQVASDGVAGGRNSPFTTALLTHLGTANTGFATLTSRITRDVMTATDNQQRPRFDISLTGELFLNKVDGGPDLDPDIDGGSSYNSSELSSDITVQTTIFNAAQSSGSAVLYQAYLDQFPTGVYAAVARAEIARLSGSGDGSQPPEPDEYFDQEQVSRMMSEPLFLTATQTVRSMPSNQGTETAMAMNKTKRKEVQLRLNLAGQNVGRPDGSWGPKTRGGISGWQAQNQLLPTGYLNSVQFQMLTANTQSAYQAHMVSNPNALNTPRPSGGSSRPSNNNAVEDFLSNTLSTTIGTALGNRLSQ